MYEEHALQRMASNIATELVELKRYAQQAGVAEDRVIELVDALNAAMAIAQQLSSGELSSRDPGLAADGA